jgi:hypothetical protein
MNGFIILLLGKSVMPFMKAVLKEEYYGIILAAIIRKKGKEGNGMEKERLIQEKLQKLFSEAGLMPASGFGEIIFKFEHGKMVFCKAAENIKFHY